MIAPRRCFFPTRDGSAPARCSIPLAPSLASSGAGIASLMLEGREAPSCGEALLPGPPRISSRGGLARPRRAQAAVRRSPGRDAPGLGPRCAGPQVATKHPSPPPRTAPPTPRRTSPIPRAPSGTGTSSSVVTTAAPDLPRHIRVCELHPVLLQPTALHALRPRTQGIMLFVSGSRLVSPLDDEASVGEVASGRCFGAMPA
jgi:hypothetical protein